MASTIAEFSNRHGRYHIENHGAGVHAVYFTRKRKGSKPKLIANTRSMANALKSIAEHEDEMDAPNAPRETGQNGPVSIYALGKRTGGTKTPTQLDAEIAAYLAAHPE
jgi:hypothetical protein